MAAPMMMSALGRLVRDDRMNPYGLSRLLVNEGESVRDLLPAGIPNLMSGRTPSPETISPSTRPVALGIIPERAVIPEPAIRSPSLWRLLPALLVPVVLYWGYRARHPVVPAPRVNRVVIRSVPGSLFLNIPRNAGESRLLAFVQNASKGLEPVTWFDFDRLLFNTNSATLRPESQGQLRNIALILKAYPNVHMQIGGFSDSSGGSLHNLTLSQDRASAVVAGLVALGVSPDRLKAQGYGDQSPVADDSTAEGRAKNRRASIRVTQNSLVPGLRSRRDSAKLNL